MNTFLNYEKSIQSKSVTFKALSNPLRLAMCIKLYENGPQNVSFFVDSLYTTQSNISQNLAKLEKMGLVHSFKNSTQVIYELVDPIAIKLIQTSFNNSVLD